jgi:hypothetical protein
MMMMMIIIIIIGTTTRKESWPPSEVSSTHLDSWLLPTSSLIPASLHPFPLLSNWHVVFPLFLVIPVAHTSVSLAYNSHPFLQHG